MDEDGVDEAVSELLAVSLTRRLVCGDGVLSSCWLSIWSASKQASGGCRMIPPLAGRPAKAGKSVDHIPNPEGSATITRFA